MAADMQAVLNSDKETEKEPSREGLVAPLQFEKRMVTIDQMIAGLTQFESRPLPPGPTILTFWERNLDEQNRIWKEKQKEREAKWKEEQAAIDQRLAAIKQSFSLPSGGLPQRATTLSAKSIGNLSMASGNATSKPRHFG